jgi:hypothetical protein
MEERLQNYDTLKYLFLDPKTSENQTAIEILFGKEKNPGRTTPTEALRIILVIREAYHRDILRDPVGFKNRVCSDSEDIEFEKAFCQENNADAKTDRDLLAIDCNRWINFFKYLRKLVLNRNGIVGGVSVERTGGRKSRSKRQRRARKTNKNQRSRRKSIHRRK